MYIYQISIYTNYFEKRNKSQAVLQVNENNEILLVQFPNTTSDPETVMIIFVDTNSTNVTMFGPVVLDHFTDVTEMLVRIIIVLVVLRKVFQFYLNNMFGWIYYSWIHCTLFVEEDVEHQQTDINYEWKVGFKVVQ